MTQELHWRKRGSRSQSFLNPHSVARPCHEGRWQVISPAFDFGMEGAVLRQWISAEGVSTRTMRSLSSIPGEDRYPLVGASLRWAYSMSQICLWVWVLAQISFPLEG